LRRVYDRRHSIGGAHRDASKKMWPVILRELRAGSRRWTTYWLRLLAASAVVVTIVWWLSTPKIILVRQPGREVFLQMHRVIMAAIWIVVPLMTADCLSREKREGTLGLLFLTNLRAWNIVFAKAAVAGLAALTMWLSVIPIITVPILMGGLPAREIVLSCSLALGSICCALAAGLLASALSNRASGAVAGAIIFAVIGHLGFCLLVEESQARAAGFGAQVGFNGQMVWSLFSPRIIQPGRGKILIAFLIPLFSLLLSALVAAMAAAIIRRNWQDKPKTKRQTEVESFFCSPVFWTGLFRRWMRFSLQRNPIGWLERRTWTGRIAALIWFAVMISFASAVVSYASAFRGEDATLNGLMWMLLISIAYVAAGSFRRERETGALELILVTPLNERQIISGRLRGIWIQFLPAFAVWLAIVVYLYSWQQHWNPANLIRFTIAYAVVPVIGLYFSLRSRFVLLSWFATLTAVFALPQFAWSAFCHFASASMRPAAWDRFVASADLFATGFVFLIQVTLAGLLLWHLHSILVRRSFSFR
jgi:ABC-type transport system involved in multi-copper enzyme maturation permease subunit